LRRLEGKYEILEKIREGGMGAIYKVRHRLLDEIRVIKLMRPQLARDEELKARFLREAQFAIKLRHPNIAQLYDFTVGDDATAFMVMEFIEGLNLADVLALHGPPPLGLTLELAQQSLKALGYLHTRGYLHRDISPDNLMLTADTEGQPLVKLIDLGIAKRTGAEGDGQLTQTGTFLGKLRYSSPEQFRGGSEVDARADLYSFGLVLYELLTARFPIQGTDTSSLIAGHLFHPPLDFAASDAAGRIPPGLRAVVLRALAKPAGDRFASAQELSRALAEFRAPGDLAGVELSRLLTRPFIPAGPASHVAPGSTQSRLDETFELGTTPSPVSLLALQAPALPEIADAPTKPIASRAGELAAAVAGIEACLDKRDYRHAESLLYAAEASLGAQEIFASLYERIEEERRRDVEERVAAHLAGARRLAAERDFPGALAEAQKARRLDDESSEVAAVLVEIAAAQRAHDLAAIEERLAEGDLDAAETLLSQAAAAHPQETEDALETLRERLAGLRREKRRTQSLAAAIAEIGGHLERGELEAAGDLLDRAAVRFGAAELLWEQWKRLEALRQAAKSQARQLAAEDAERADLWEAIQAIADLVSRREPQEALKELKSATARFGDNAELRELRKRIAGMLLSD
jgi:serine/threonine-protein kinase